LAFISHPNTDHFAALGELVRRRRLGRAYVNEQFGVSPSGSADPFSPDVRMLAAMQEAGVAVVRLSAGQRVKLDDRTTVQVLWPPPGRKDLDANGASLVLRITCDGASVVLPGDIETIGQQELAAANTVAADVLMLPHHGSWWASLERFVKAVRPKVVLASAAREPYGPPAQEEPAEFFDRLRTGYRYYSTPRNGWIQVRFGRAGLDVRTMR
jgi:competence protein ComEC